MRVTRSLVSPWLRPRLKSSHKGSHGHLLLCGGSASKPGSIMLAGYASLRAGVGLSTVVLPHRAFEKFPENFLELMFVPMPDNRSGEFVKIPLKRIREAIDKKTAIAVGPGMGLGAGPKAVLKSLIQESAVPLVMDADALTILAQEPRLLESLKGKPVILTPHAGEMSRLTGRSAKTIAENRAEIALSFAVEHRVFLLLKGHQTVMATPSGKIFVNSTGNPGMATAGMGDTLTGIIGALLAQGYPTDQAMILGAWIHGRAGDRVAARLGQRGLLAHDVSEELPFAFKELTRPPRKC